MGKFWKANGIVLKLRKAHEFSFMHIVDTEKTEVKYKLRKHGTE